MSKIMKGKAIATSVKGVDRGAIDEISTIFIRKRDEIIFDKASLTEMIETQEKTEWEFGDENFPEQIERLITKILRIDGLRDKYTGIKVQLFKKGSNNRKYTEPEFATKNFIIVLGEEIMNSSPRMMNSGVNFITHLKDEIIETIMLDNKFHNIKEDKILTTVNGQRKNIPINKDTTKRSIINIGFFLSVDEQQRIIEEVMNNPLIKNRIGDVSNIGSVIGAMATNGLIQ